MLDNSSITVGAIVCGGRGTRLRHLTKAYPKHLLPVGGSPLLHRIAQQFPNQIELVLISSFEHEQIAEFSRQNLPNACLVTDQQLCGNSTALGPWGGVALLLLHKPEIRRLVVWIGDVFSDLCVTKLLKHHSITKADVTATVSLARLDGVRGVFHLKDERYCYQEVFVNADKTVNIGVYVLGPRAIDLLAARAGAWLAEEQIFADFEASKLKVVPFDACCYHRNVNRPEDLLHVHNFITPPHQDLPNAPRSLLMPGAIVKPSVLASNSVISWGAVVSHEVEYHFVLPGGVYESLDRTLL